MTHPQSIAAGHTVPATHAIRKAGILDTLAVFTDVLLPTIAKGPIVRRRAVMSLAERFDLDRRAIRRMQRIRRKYGPAPLLLRLPGRSIALILDPADVHAVLERTPEPFATATREKRAALAHFQPAGVLISHGADRADRRRYNETVLQSGRRAHEFAETFLEIISEEASTLHRDVGFTGELGWDDFAPAWFRIVRRVVFGGAARDEHEISSLMFRLRSAGNWAFLRPQRPALRDELFRRIRAYMRKAEPGSLAAVMSATEATSRTVPEQQVPQWLFAFDPAGMATFRALALLTSHPEYGRQAREEISSHAATSARLDLPFLRATVLESLRLWPTTPLLLRETTAETAWENGVMPSGTAIVIFTPFFHRDSERLPYADVFTPDLWIPEDASRAAALIPFSEGPAACPGRNLVLMLASAMIAAVLDRWRIRLRHPAKFRDGERLPATLNHYAVRFDVRS